MRIVDLVAKMTVCLGIVVAGPGVKGAERVPNHPRASKSPHARTPTAPNPKTTAVESPRERAGSQVIQTVATVATEPLAPRQDRAQLASLLAPILRDPPCDGLVVFEVVPGSQADREEVVAGDILTHYDGQPVGTTQALSELARIAISGDRKSILVLFQHAGEERALEFEPAPLGVRLAAIRKGTSATLWRDATPFIPDPAALERQLARSHRWERLTRGARTVGWAHHYVVRQGSGFARRSQTYLQTEGQSERRDVTVTFEAGPFLSLRSLKVVVDDKLVLNLAVSGDVLKGERAGIPVEAPFEADAVSCHLAPLVAAQMPPTIGACLRSSYLEYASLFAAPFSDLACVAREKVPAGGDVVDAFRYEQTVFGSPVADFWIDAERDVVRVRLADGLESARVTESELAAEFPEFAATFTPIEAIPPTQSAPKAN